MSAVDWAERGWVPDFMLRLAIRRLLRIRLADEHAGDPHRQAEAYAALIGELRKSPIAIETGAANRQHYEVPAAFYRIALGRHLKYSSGLWDDTSTDLDQAEQNMLELTCERAALQDGQQILELGCGWGSLTLWIAQRYPNSRITAVSNSASQRGFILDQARRLGLTNIDVLTRDVNDLEPGERFDRVVSVEMFEHVRNYQHLMGRIARWLKPGGLLFVHIFCHRFLMYPFETEGEGNWMGKHFFTGGLMPAADTLLCFQDDLKFQRRWLVDGSHYSKTARAWLERLDRNRAAAREVFAADPAVSPDLRIQRWRMFFMACEELFRFDQGRQWMVGHFLFARRPGSAA